MPLEGETHALHSKVCSGFQGMVLIQFIIKTTKLGRYHKTTGAGKRDFPPSKK
jgi:hypothetical protein